MIVIRVRDWTERTRVWICLCVEYAVVGRSVARSLACFVCSHTFIRMYTRCILGTSYTPPTKRKFTLGFKSFCNRSTLHTKSALKTHFQCIKIFAYRVNLNLCFNRLRVFIVTVNELFNYVKMPVALKIFGGSLTGWNNTKKKLI